MCFLVFSLFFLVCVFIDCFHVSLIAPREDREAGSPGSLTLKHKQEATVEYVFLEL